MAAEIIAWPKAESEAERLLDALDKFQVQVWVRHSTHTSVPSFLLFEFLSDLPDTQAFGLIAEIKHRYASNLAFRSDVEHACFTVGACVHDVYDAPWGSAPISG